MFCQGLWHNETQVFEVSEKRLRKKKERKNENSELLPHNRSDDIYDGCILLFCQLTKAIFPKQSTPPHNNAVCMFVFPFICKRIYSNPKMDFVFREFFRSKYSKSTQIGT